MVFAQKLLLILKNCSLFLDRSMAFDYDNDFVSDIDLELIKVPGVRIEISGANPPLQFTGTLCTEYHHVVIFDELGDLALESRQRTLDILKLEHNIELPFRISYQLIDSLVESLSPPDAHVVLICKHFYTYKITFPTSSKCSDVASYIRVMKERMNTQIQFLPAFHYQHQCDDLHAGWQMFSLLSTLQKMNQNANNMQFRISDLNKGFGVCLSYPERIIVPVTVTDEELVQSSKFREGGRFPVVCYYHAARQTTLVRCSQPLVTAMNRTCHADQRVLAMSSPAFKARVAKDPKMSPRSYIVDTRTQADASSDKVRGGGYESEGYTDAQRFHHFQRPLERVSNLLDSLVKFIKALKSNHSSVESYLLAIEGSKWLEHVRSLITHACLLQQLLNQEFTSAVVHGLEGRDTTLCSTSLAQMIMDPECRTIRGFQELIHREWILAGHQFQNRHSSLFVQNKARDSRKVSAPVFLLFLDAVWQYTRCFPTHFEFNEEFLIFLAESSYAGIYGNFLCNSELERVSNAVFSKTLSLWQHLSDDKNCSRFKNELYDPNRVRSMVFPVSPESFVPWTGLYSRKNEKNLKLMMEKAKQAKRMNKKLVIQASLLQQEKMKLLLKIHEKMGDC